MAFLNVGKLPTERTYDCKDGSSINMVEVVNSVKPLIRTMCGTGLIDDNKSFGLAMTRPRYLNDDSDAEPYWNDPLDYVWFTGGWGPDRYRYVANAVRKLRPLIRDGENISTYWSTLDMVLEGDNGAFQDRVESANTEGMYPWGDFAYGGAVALEFGPLTFDLACSAFNQIDDDTISRIIGGNIGKRIVIGDSLLPVPVAA